MEELQHPGCGFQVPGRPERGGRQLHGCSSTAKAPDGPFAKWDLETSHGDEIAEFRADSAADTDGDTATCTRAVPATTPLDAGFRQPVRGLVEHMVIQASGKKAEQKVVLMIQVSAASKERDTPPALGFLAPVQGLGSQMASTDDLAEELGFDDNQVSLDGAGKSCEARNTEQWRAVMLAVRAEK